MTVSSTVSVPCPECGRDAMATVFRPKADSLPDDPGVLIDRFRCPQACTPPADNVRAVVELCIWGEEPEASAR